MNETIKRVVIGLILGDGYLTPSFGHSQRSVLDIKGDNKCLSYLQWLHRVLQPLGVSELKPKKGYHQHRFYTKVNGELGMFRKLFYPQGVKIIPENIKALLNHPLTLAVWYQDDGTLDCRDKYHYNALFATHCFSFRECVLLAKTLEANFGLDVRVCKCRMRGKLRFRLYIVSRSMDRFINLVKPYINPCFAYKIRKLNSQQQR